MGVRRYHNKFRAALSINGKSIQKYFTNEEDAESFIFETKLEQGNLNGNFVKKRITSTHQDLPIGLMEYTYSKTKDDIEYNYNVIVGTVSLGGKVSNIKRHFGDRRTREDAIEICQSWRLKKLSSYEP